MFGISKRLNALEESVNKLKQRVKCEEGEHEWSWMSGWATGIIGRGEYLEGLECDHCGKIKKYTEIKEEDK